MYNLSEWHRGTPTVPPVGAVNVPAENTKKINKFHIFEDFPSFFSNTSRHFSKNRNYFQISQKSGEEKTLQKTVVWESVLATLLVQHLRSESLEKKVAGLQDLTAPRAALVPILASLLCTFHWSGEV